MKRILFLTAFSLIMLSTRAASYPYNPPKRPAFTSSNLPIVVITLDEAIKKKETKERSVATMTILDRKDGGRNQLSDIAESPNYSDESIFNYYGKIGIRYRGSSSFSMSDKKPFQLRTENTDGSKKPADILGMGADDNWTLLAPYADKSLMRDVLVFDLTRGYFDYVPRARYCELVIEGVYQGIYILAARARKGDHRLQLPKPGAEGDALTGGYLLDIDRTDDPGFYSNHKAWNKEKQEVVGSFIYYQYKYPDAEDLLPIQKTYIENAIHEFEDVLKSREFDDPVNGYRAHIDTMSAINYILTQEFTHNVDGYRLSTPIYKYNDARDPRFKFSLWDFNLSLGNNNYMGAHTTYDWGYLEFSSENGVNIPFWFRRLIDDPPFFEAMRKQWCLFRSTSHDIEHINHKIDSLATHLNEAQKRNFAAWDILGKYVWPNLLIYDTWEEELDYLRNFVEKRIEWIDNEFELLPIETVNCKSTLSYACKGFEVTITANPAPDGMEFDCWMGDLNLLDNPNSETVSFIMPDVPIYFEPAYRTVIDTERAETENTLHLYPNPAKGHIHIANTREGTTFAIINQVGQTLLTGTAANGETIDISALPPGAYIVKAANASSFFVKE